MMRPVASSGRLTFGGRDIVDSVLEHFLKIAKRKMPRLAQVPPSVGNGNMF